MKVTILSGPKASGKTFISYAIMKAYKPEKRVVYECFARTVIGTIRQIKASSDFDVILLEECVNEEFINLVLKKIPNDFKSHLIFTTLSDIEADSTHLYQIIKCTYR